MKKDILNRMYQKANADLAKAQDELFKPKEDVVNYSCCISARSALYHFLGCLCVLEQDHGDIDSLEKGTAPMDQLIERAGKRYSEVAKMDFSGVQCSHKDIKNVLNNDEIYFCNNTDIVNNCTTLANQLKQIVNEQAANFVQP